MTDRRKTTMKRQKSIEKGLPPSVLEELDEIDDSPLGLDNDVEINSEVIAIAPRWEQFGRALNIKQTQLDLIKAESGPDSRDCLSKTIQEFLRRNYDWKTCGDPSWKLVVIAIGHKVGAADTNLALQVAKDHQKLSPLRKRSRTDSYDYSLLMEASRIGNVESARKLLDRGANPNLTNSEGWTALMAATRNRQSEMVDLLLERGADPNLQDHMGWSALMAAVFDRHDEIALKLIQAGAIPHVQDKNKTNALLLTIARNDQDKVVNALLNSKPDVNLQDSYGETALIFACKRGNLALVKRLLSMGANPNICNNAGQSPAFIAIGKCNDDILEEILSHDVNPDSGIVPPLMMAGYMGSDKTAEILIAHGADTTKQSKAGLTAYEIADINHHSDLAKKLNTKQSLPAKPTDIISATLKALASLKEHLNLGPLFMEPEKDQEKTTEEDSYGFGFLSKFVRSLAQ